ncbi:aminomethyl-transferring glycine dehydrogenase subunit GcvPA [Alteribacillus bidgolensis]|uniref:Probable glycine dehydrogenase (decarboxylating) subunit 1 n=1 Tax=Alteribacillus bidgolensis TaxID=930129 RepID=A0A1G8BMN8_9BACI|nr:aminomethyl-transferring glycine dehydrogenase subunit GcvPA [Alteribacillus bidgolensis]SDH34485.1 glycine dehydrogenase (decarboxylating) alpha subunit [Alteribacillus bidgolensis]
MSFRYLPMTEEDKQEMLDYIGVKSTGELFSEIPEKIRFTGEMNLASPLSEPALIKEFQQLSSENDNIKVYPSFLGAGVYDHYIPSVVDHVIRRSEFYTAYTPYQPEISQGELQAIFEFQTMICELTGMEIANSSMYDGATALAEAALVAASYSKMKKTKIIVSEGVHPEALEVLKTYASGPDLTVQQIPLLKGQTDVEAVKDAIDDSTAGVIVQYPNFYGSLENLKEMEKAAHDYKSLFIVSSNPLALGVLTPPGEFGADIVIGDAQPFGIPSQMGGPHCGYFAASKKLMRKVPGRLVGQTVDEDGRRGFVLTIQAREQHIRRDKATSNICSNQALNALAASVAMSALGKKGLRQMAVQNIKNTNYLKEQVKNTGINIVNEQPVFNEFVIDVKRPVSSINKKLKEKGIIGGFDLSKVDNNRNEQMLVCVTELRSKEEMDYFARELEGAVNAD